MYSIITDFVVQVSRQYVSFLRKNYSVTSQLFRKEAEIGDIEEVTIKSVSDFKKVVKEYTKPKNLEKISFAIPKEDFNHLVDFFALKGKTKTAIGQFIFYRVLQEVSGNGEGKETLY